MDNNINEQIKAAEELMRYTQDYLAIKKLLKTIKTGCAATELKTATELLNDNMKKCMEVL